MSGAAAAAAAASGCKDFDEDAAAGDQAMGVWQILWSKGGVPQRQAFEASVATYVYSGCI